MSNTQSLLYVGAALSTTARFYFAHFPPVVNSFAAELEADTFDSRSKTFEFYRK